MSQWKTRFNVRLFDSEVGVDEEHLDRLLDIIPYVPSQRSVNDHIWFVLRSPEHDDIKEWLVKNVHYYLDKDGVTREYMASVISAPVVFFACELYPTIKNSSSSDSNRNIGIGAGALVSEALSLGYDTSFVGCCEAFFKLPFEEKKAKSKELSSLLIDAFGDSFLTDASIDPKEFRVEPNLSLCIGKGDPAGRVIASPYSSKYSEYRGYRYFRKRKPPKSWSYQVK